MTRAWPFVAPLTNDVKLFETEMDNFFALFRRYLNDKAKSNAVFVSLTRARRDGDTDYE